ncbi:MAG: hypothetical protein ACTSWD_09510 [Candidatus Heimdallarchaeota archaeon]
MNPKFKVNEDVFVVKDYKIVKCKIEKIVISETVSGKTLDYVVTPLNETKTKSMSFAEAYLVETLEEAKQSALANWETISRNVKRQLETLTEESYKKQDEEQK